jgi:hypothetical protein
VPQQALRLREPLWLRPWPQPLGSAALEPTLALSPSLPALPPLASDLQLLALRLSADGATACLALQNLSACRVRLDLGRNWQVLERLDGLDQPLQVEADAMTVLQPWSCGFWRISRRDRQRDH